MSASASSDLFKAHESACDAMTSAWISLCLFLSRHS